MLVISPHRALHFHYNGGGRNRDGILQDNILKAVLVGSICGAICRIRTQIFTEIAFAELCSVTFFENRLDNGIKIAVIPSCGAAVVCCLKVRFPWYTQPCGEGVKIPSPSFSLCKIKKQ